MNNLIVFNQGGIGLDNLETDSALKINLQEGKLIFNDMIHYFSNIVELSKILEKHFVFTNIIVIGSILNFSSEINVKTLFSTFIGISQENFEYIDYESTITSRSDLLSRIFNALDINPLYKKGNGIINLKVEKNTSNRWNDFEQQLTFNEINKNMLSPDEFLRDIQNALQNQKPFSFLRIQHDENKFLGYGFSYSYAEIEDFYKNHWGYILDAGNTSHLSLLIRESVINSNAIGIPTLNKKSSNRIHQLENTTFNHLRILNAYKNKKFTPINFHDDFSKSADFKALLIQAKTLYIITSKDISPLVTLLSRDIIRIPIPEEIPNAVTELNEVHYPNIFLKVSNFISQEIKPGSLVLVGAGLLGIIYCDLIKKSGGIALDLGSFIDTVLDTNYQKNGSANGF